MEAAQTDATVRPAAGDLARPREEWTAVAGLALGTLGVACGLLGLAGLALSVLALHRIERSGGRLAGRSSAMVGVAAGAVTALAWEVGVVLWLRYGAGVALPLVDGLLPR